MGLVERLDLHQQGRLRGGRSNAEGIGHLDDAEHFFDARQGNVVVKSDFSQGDGQQAVFIQAGQDMGSQGAVVDLQLGGYLAQHILRQGFGSTCQLIIGQV